MKRDLTRNLASVLLLEPFDAVKTTVASNILDIGEYASAEVEAIIGAITGVDGSNHVTPVLQESNTTVAGDFTAVAASNIIGGFSKVDATTKDSVIQRAGYKGTKRYIRVNFVYVGAGISAGIIGAIGLLGHPKYAPVTSPSAVAAT